MTKSKSNPGDKPPNHLRPATQRWWSEVVETFELDIHHLKLLTKACEAHERCETARELIAKHGLTFEDRWGNPKARPECNIERDSRRAFSSLIREIGLDVSPPTESRPAPLRANR
jgi:P27 family predicted phage terminase small subunit